MTITAETTDAPTPMHDRLAALEQENRTLTDQLLAARQRAERMNESACEWADRNDLCAQFEAFCEEWGWQGRRRDYQVDVKATMNLRFVVESGFDADSYDLAEELGDLVMTPTLRAALESALSNAMGRDVTVFADLDTSVEDYMQV